MTWLRRDRHLTANDWFIIAMLVVFNIVWLWYLLVGLGVIR